MESILVHRPSVSARPGELGSRHAAQLEAANAQLKRFAHSLAHDLRAPLAVICGFSEMLDQSLDDQRPEQARHYVRRIRAAGKQLDDYLEALLSLARVSQASVHVAEVDLSAMARSVLADLQMREPGRVLAADVEEGLQAQGDPRLLRMLLENLLGNAWKFTSQREDGLIEVGRLAASSVFSVRDNGVGFDMAYANKLFGAFQRLHTEAEFPGTGIGLATVRRIVTRHQGRVWAESQVGIGTTFFFTLSDSAPPAWLAGDAD